MSRERRVEVIISGDARGLGAALGDAGGHLDKFGGRVDGWGTKVTGAVAGAFAVDKLLSFGGELQGLGTKLDTIEKKAGAVFSGGALGSVQAWADGVATSMGLTSTEAVGLATNMGDLLKPMGFTSQEAAGMSTKMLDLAGALSAWSGGSLSAAEVADVMTKAMLGERDGLKQLGISISEADVQARLAEKGQKNLTGAALEQAKALATQELILEKSTDAQAAWADGTMDAVKRQNELKAANQRTKESLATSLLPAFQAFQRALAGVAPVVTALAGVVGPVLGAGLEAAGAAFGFIASHAEVAAPLLAVVGTVLVGTLVPAVVAHTAALWAQAAAWVAANAPLVLAAAAIAAVVAAVVLLVKHWGTVVDALKAAVGWITDVGARWEDLKEVFGKVIGWLGELAPQIAGKLAEWAAAFVRFAADLAVQLPGKLAEVTAAVVGWVAELAVKLTEWVVTEAIPGLLTKLAEFGAALVGWVVEQVAALPAHVAELATGLLSWVATAVADIPAKLGEVATKIWEFVAGVATDMPSKVADIVTKFWTWITDIVTAIPAKLGEITATIAEWAGKIPAVVASAAAGAFDLLFDGFKAAWDSVASVINRGIDIFNRLPGPDLPNVPTFATFGSVTSHLNQGGGGGLHVGIGTDPSLHAPAGTKMMALGGFLPVGGSAIVGEAGAPEAVTVTSGGAWVTPLGPGRAGNTYVLHLASGRSDRSIRDEFRRMELASAVA